MKQMKEMKKRFTNNFNEQAKLLNPYVDFFILMFGVVLKNLNVVLKQLKNLINLI
jgi:hypothetical protein